MESFEQKLHETKDWLQKEYAAIRTGQATPGLLDSVRVDSYGAKVPMNQVGNVGVEDARTLRVSAWDTGVISNIEQAIREADLGVSIVTDSSGLRVIFPELTSERREQLLRLAKSKFEDARIRIRGARDEAMKDIDKQEKDGELSEDEKFSEKERIQALVDETNKDLEGLFVQKEAELKK